MCICLYLIYSSRNMKIMNKNNKNKLEFYCIFFQKFIFCSLTSFVQKYKMYKLLSCYKIFYTFMCIFI